MSRREPTLIEFRGKAAVAVTTKMGNVFVLDRDTGKPLFTVEERAVPKSDIPGEDAAPSQPMPEWSAMVPQKLRPRMTLGTHAGNAQVVPGKDRIAIATTACSHRPRFKGTISFPGNIGGVNWGGAAWDPVRNILIANTNRVAAVAKLIPRADMAAAREKTRGNGVARRIRAAERHAVRHASGLAGIAIGLPCNAPPWGALVAFDLKTGKLRWEAPLGRMGDWRAAGIDQLRRSYGHGGWTDLHRRRARSAPACVRCGHRQRIWTVELPASAQSTPMTYRWQGKQYIVICAGGHGKMKSKMGDSVVAFRLGVQ